MARTRGGTARARALGAELRETRKTARRTVRSLAAEIGVNHARLTRCETGQHAAPVEMVATIMTALGAPTEERERLVDMARGAHEPDWLAAGKGGAHRELTTLIEYERTAVTITDVSSGLIPGLLQTADYARTIMSEVPPGEIETRVMMRVGRRAVLDGQHAPQFSALITEHALTEPIGGPAVMAAQLRHILEFTNRSNVEVRVIPTGLQEFHPARVGSFMLFEFDKGDPIVHLEHYKAPVFLTTPAVAHSYRNAVDTLHKLAMSPSESAERIAQHAKRVEDESE